VTDSNIQKGRPSWGLKFFLNPLIFSHSQISPLAKGQQIIEYKLLSLSLSLSDKVLTTARPSYLHNLISYHSSTSSQYALLICCHSFSLANYLLIENHRSLIYICITSSLESTSRFIPSASPFLSRFTSSSTDSWLCHLTNSRLKTYLFNKSFPP